MTMSDKKEIHRVFLIADLSGYTALTEAHGNISAVKIVNRYIEIVQEILDEGAQIADSVGDEVLIVGKDATQIVQIALDLRDKVEKEPNFPTLHIGIHAGHVLEQEGRFFGSALNIAARVASYARADQILCTNSLIKMLTQRNAIKYCELGEVHFKNLIEPIPLFEISDDHHKIETLTDPVCRMRVKPDSAPARLPYNGKIYFFCSFECAKAFVGRPDQYTNA